VSELENGVNVARAILPARLDELPILVLNVSIESCEINAETVLTKLSMATCVGNSAESALTADEGGRSYKHLSKLLEGVDERVSEEQRVELIKILREYADVFSTGENTWERRHWRRTKSTQATPDRYDKRCGDSHFIYLIKSTNML